MAWETVEDLPGKRSGGAFRSGAEPVVAERHGLAPAEWLRLFWHSTPERPIRRAAYRVVVTPHHVYVQRRDQTRARVRLDRLRGERLEKGLLVYGVVDDEDLLLPYRPRCAVQDHLTGAVRGGATVEPWRQTRGVLASAITALALLGVSGGLLGAYPVGRMLVHVRAGLYTSEQALGTYACFAAFALTVSVFAWLPSRWRVDAVGVTRTRGVAPWLPFTVPPECFVRAILRPSYHKEKGRPRYHAGWWVDLELDRPARVGTLFRVGRVEVSQFSFDPERSGEGRQRAESDAHALAERLRLLLALDETVVESARA